MDSRYLTPGHQSVLVGPGLWGPCSPWGTKLPKMPESPLVLWFCFAVFSPEQRQCAGCSDPRFWRAPCLLSISVSIHLFGPLIQSPSLSASTSPGLANFVFPWVSPSLPCSTSLSGSDYVFPLLCSPVSPGTSLKFHNLFLGLEAAGE